MSPLNGSGASNPLGSTICGCWKTTWCLPKYGEDVRGRGERDFVGERLRRLRLFGGDLPLPLEGLREGDGDPGGDGDGAGG